MSADPTNRPEPEKSPPDDEEEPSLNDIAQRLIAEGRMPTFDRVVEALTMAADKMRADVVRLQGTHGSNTPLSTEEELYWRQVGRQAGRAQSEEEFDRILTEAWQHSPFDGGSCRREMTMTVSVCLQCGSVKRGAFVPCPKCGHHPKEARDRAKHLLLSDHYFQRHELEAFGERISHGDDWVLDHVVTERFVAEFVEAERQEEVVNQSEDLIEDYRTTLEGEDLSFFDELPEYTQAVTARLNLYGTFSQRVERAREEGGWSAAAAEFTKLLEEEPRLRPLEIRRTPAGADSYVIVHP
jgi:hypothetical protein